ncbi:peptidylprolyl isomerase [Clostridium tagluense]|uniref:peptidylprolyl isomerase n=1 Tax=Clostridium tagluense TaxID=360422 RepID=UPI001CF46100|nr:peptidylprolyl isomerase [Clostridium tagluense]MCB2314330.1 peptidylprolyl isomerase [Clostridium tagluense]MCB2319179.1 peptidylprolyl isomerase [Clostridium tagluense]MCB2324074.1 peptidylprolyl isomerase [Clostridium tagluense]MCB2328923.1 peptidylprolyl isomerase [Clostridium tagluense]MCB2333780.1 peptidylprolyl isomerase [Clostridium tagluense]
MENKVLAIVNGSEITEKDIERSLLRFPNETREHYKTEEGKKQFLEQIINFELIYNYALDNDMKKDPEYIEQVKLIEKDILIQIGVKNIMADVDITEEEIQKYYETNSEMFKSEETASAKHILVDTLEQTQEIKLEIDNGMSFEEAAQKYSKCPSAAQGGSLGSFTRGRMVPEFEKAAFELQVGEISEPVKTQFGYHLIQLDEKSLQDVKSLEESRNVIVKNILHQKQNEKYISSVTELKNKYAVELK